MGWGGILQIDETAGLRRLCGEGPGGLGSGTRREGMPEEADPDLRAKRPKVRLQGRWKTMVWLRGDRRWFGTTLKAEWWHPIWRGVGIVHRGPRCTTDGSGDAAV